jgi:hypothetical protein
MTAFCSLQKEKEENVTPLIDAIKQLRQIKSPEGIVTRNLEWDLNEAFAFRPMNRDTLTDISCFVDTRLAEYASIQGWRSPPIKHRQVHLPARLDEHVNSSRDPHVDGFARSYSDYIQQPTLLQEERRRYHRTMRFMPEEIKMVTVVDSINPPKPVGVERVIHSAGPNGEASDGRLKAYVTSYDIDHTSMTISARIIAADPSIRLEADIWSGLMTNDTYNATPKRYIHDIVKANLCILNKSRAYPVPSNIDPAEKVALETLREMITEEQFRQYLRYGFIVVSGKSGRKYQVYRNRAHTNVYVDGKKTEEICVRIKDRAIPLTDNIIAFKAMIEIDEDMFRSSGNIYKGVQNAGI